jgi:DNA-binding MarR family transcriptional regulator
MNFTLKDLPTREVLENFAEKFREIDVEAVLLLLKFNKTSREIMNAAEKHFAGYGLSTSRFTAMMLLYRFRKKGGLSASELAEKTGISRATATGIIDGLEKTGYAKREKEKSTDRRRITITLTEKGLEFLNSILPDHYRKISGMMSFFSKKEKETFLGNLETLSNNVRKFIKVNNLN